MFFGVQRSAIFSLAILASVSYIACLRPQLGLPNDHGRNL